VLETVTIDLFIIRNLGLVLKRFPQVEMEYSSLSLVRNDVKVTHAETTEFRQVALDVVGLVDEWAARFFEELDYINEGENGLLFAEMMREDLPQVIPLVA
jgi:aarF domain-containing kinase